MRLKEAWLKIRAIVLVIAIPILWISYGFMLQPTANFPRHTLEWGISRLVMLGVAVAFGFVSWKLLDKATQ